MPRSLYKRKNSRWKRRTLFLGILLTIFIGILFASSAFRVFQKQADLNDGVRAMESEVNTLEDENEALQQVLAYIKTPEFIELQAKHKLGLKRPDEEVVVITDVGVKGIIDSYIDDIYGNGSAQEVVSNPVRWWQYFFGGER